MRKDAWTHEKFWQRFNELPDKDLYTVVELPEKLSAYTKVKFKCQQNHVFTPTIHSFFASNSRCIICGCGKRWSEERFWQEISRLEDKDNFVFSDYEPVLREKPRFMVTCKICQHTWKARVHAFFREGHRCQVCENGRQWSKERIEQEHLLTDDYAKFSLVIDNEIKNAASVFIVKCIYGHQWETTPNTYFTKNHRCPVCCQSRGEESIALFLENNDIAFEREKKFPDCKNVLPLPFDFYLPDFNMLLEMQGIQHYQIVPRSRSEEKNLKEFEQIQKRDAIKKQWAIDNGYRFLEISYKEINQIEDILSKELGI